MKIGAVAGSFDPITNGHIWLISAASVLVDKLYVVIARNQEKKSLFTFDERLQMCDEAFNEVFPRAIHDKIEIKYINNELLFDWASHNNVTHIFRGLRDTQDYVYENSMQVINKDIAASINTVFFMTPPELIGISSSTVKAIAGFDNWESRICKYVPAATMRAFREKVKI